ncbi:hypothetical protein P43SY_006849 [Pythium insidiosum]|uniref:non-specific serine/threonine protein kinase n=1 Tax=Pythium insidiosum TaxID=114742 RepID=A0AAD5Q764_PYTIN|nr:hypothetical protein P43SY_006849 [Pythium insidiosum]
MHDPQRRRHVRRRIPPQWARWTCLALLGVHSVRQCDAAAAQTIDSAWTPGRVSAIDLSIASGTLPPNVLTTRCGNRCAGVSDAVACVVDDQPNASCATTGPLGPGIACGSESTLCLSPARFRWRFEFSQDDELLSSRRNGQQPLYPDLGVAITLDARRVRSIEGLVLANDTTQLLLRTAQPDIHLDLPVTDSALIDWQFLELLSIQGLDLSGLTKAPPLFPRLVSLDLAGTRLARWPVVDAPLLSILDIHANDVAVLPARSLPSTLMVLNASFNKLKEFPADIQPSMERLFRLSLSHNSLPDLKEFPKLPGLKELFLASCDLAAVPTGLANLPMLEVLDLSNNSFALIPDSALPATLNTLIARNCGLTKLPNDFNIDKTWQLMDLSDNLLEPISREALPASLTELYLSKCMLTSLPLDLQDMRSSLQRLDVSTNRIEDVSLTNFSSLQYLNLRNNSLKSFPFDIFSMPQLRFLDLRDNAMANVTLSEEQIAFITTQLSDFAIDPQAFVTSLPCAEARVLRGVYSVCIRTEMRSDNSSGAPTTPPNPAETKSHGGTSAGVNIALAASIVVVFVLAVLLAKRRSKALRPSLDDQEYNALTTNRRDYAPIDMWEDPELLSWRVDVLAVSLVMQIGGGEHCAVWLARLRGESVVAKRLVPSKKPDKRLFQRFVMEIKVLGRLEHPNIVQFIGVTWTCNADLQMLLEFMSNGDLHGYLASTKCDASAKVWTSQKLSIAMDVANALAYLHSLEPPVSHRSLHSRNVLLDEAFTAKVANSGAYVDPKLEVMTCMSTTSSRSFAPELLSSRRHNSDGDAVDMYAFGILLLELDSHELPFSDVTLSNGQPLSEQAMLELLGTGALQPTISPNCPTPIARLILECVSFDPRERPTSSDALGRLELAADLCRPDSILTVDLHDSEAPLTDAYAERDSERARGPPAA